MLRTLQRRKGIECGLSLLVITSLLFSLLPVPAGASASAAAQAVQLQDGISVLEPVPPPEPAPQWPEAGERVQYAPGAEPLPAPATLNPAPEPGTEVEAPWVAGLPPIPDLVLPTAPVEIVLGGELRQA